MGPATVWIKRIAALRPRGLLQKQFEYITVDIGFPQPTMVAEGEACLQVRRLPSGGGSGAGL